jgi:hypothetical protein
MKVYKEAPFILVPIVLILDVILLVVSCFAGYSILVFLFSLILSLAVLSRCYLKYQHNKIS